MTARLLVVIGHSFPDSFNHALAKRYVDAARDAGSEVRVIDLARDPVPAFLVSHEASRMPREGDAPLEPSTRAYIESVEWAEHIVVFYPQWWGTYPAAFKAFVDGVFLSGFAHRYVGESGWEKLLRGRTARIVTTMDGPGWWNWGFYRRASDVSIARATFWYCGVHVVGITRLAKVRNSTKVRRERWLTKMARLGAKDAQRTPSKRAA